MKKVLGLTTAAFVSIGLLAGCGSDLKDRESRHSVMKSIPKSDIGGIGLKASKGVLYKTSEGYKLTINWNNVKSMAILSKQPHRILKTIDSKYFPAHNKQQSFMRGEQPRMLLKIGGIDRKSFYVTRYTNSKDEITYNLKPVNSMTWKGKTMRGQVILVVQPLDKNY